MRHCLKACRKVTKYIPCDQEGLLFIIREHINKGRRRTDNVSQPTGGAFFHPQRPGPSLSLISIRGILEALLVSRSRYKRDYRSRIFAFPSCSICYCIPEAHVFSFCSVSAAPSFSFFSPKNPSPVRCTTVVVSGSVYYSFGRALIHRWGFAGLDTGW